MPNISYDGIHFPYEDTGCGKATVTFLHPFGGSMECWREQRTFFDGKDYRVVLTDARGHGRNSGTAQEGKKGEYSLELFANDFGYMLSNVDPAVHKTHLIGASMGAMVALDYALKYPERIGKLVLVGCFAGPLLRDGKQYAEENRKMQREFEKDHKKKRRGKIDQLVEEKVVPYFGKPLAAMDDDEAQRCRRYFRSFCDMTPENYIAADLAILHKRDQRGDLWKLGKDLPHRLLYVAGRNDFFAEEQEEMQRNTPKSDLAWMEDAGHLCWLNKPEVFNRIIADFLEQ